MEIIDRGLRVEVVTSQGSYFYNPYLTTIALEKSWLGSALYLKQYDTDGKEICMAIKCGSEWESERVYDALRGRLS